MKNKSIEYKSDIIDEFLKESSIESKLRVLFEMEYLTIIIKPDRQATDEEIKEAHECEKKMTKRTLESFEELENNGRPK